MGYSRLLLGVACLGIVASQTGTCSASNEHSATFGAGSLGMVLKIRDGRLMVTGLAATSDNQAVRGGVMIGDRLVAIKSLSSWITIDHTQPPRDIIKQ
jgi:hypothetical protein